MTRRLSEMKLLREQALAAAVAEGGPASKLPSPLALHLMAAFPGMSQEEAEMWEDVT